MSWVTVVWSMIASACLTLGAIYAFVWYRNRTAWAHLLFAATAVSTAAFTFCELRLMRVKTPAELLVALWWGHLAMLFWLVSIIWFVRTYLNAGRVWLAWALCAMRALYLLANFLFAPSVNFREITSLRQVTLLGDSVTIFKGIPNPWMLVGYATMLLMLFFVADATVTVWRRGDRRKALMVGGSVLFFLLLGNVETALIYWRDLPIPITLSPLYLGLVAVMGYEVSRDVLLRASQLVRELQTSEAGLRESEARLSLAAEAADFGIWIQDLTRDEIWASDKWRQLFGFSPQDRLEFSAIMARLHPDDREGLTQAIAQASAGVNQGRYWVEYRLTPRNGATPWISSRGRVECDATGEPVLIRGTALDVTERKRAELVVRNLTGRVLAAQEEERRRIASELHDHLGQRVSLLAIEIDQVAMASAHRAPPAESMRQLGERTAEISREIHNLSHRLHSAKLEALGLQTAVQGLCRELHARGLDVQLVAENVPRPLSYEVGLCLFRVVQEGLNNVVKHSGAREARVTLIGNGVRLLLTIADSGRGFDATAAAGRDGLGLVSMRERVHLVGGHLTVTSDPGHGASIRVSVPIAEAGGKEGARPLPVD